MLKKYMSNNLECIFADMLVHNQIHLVVYFFTKIEEKIKNILEQKFY